MPEVVGGTVVTVAEAPRSDVGLGRAFLDSNTRKALKVDVGEIVQLIGKRSTGVTILGVKQGDEGKGIVRIDGLVRRNAGVNLDDKVEVMKVEALPAERVTIAPIIGEGHKISFGAGLENFVKHGLLKRPLNKCDVLIVPGIALMGGPLPFMVLSSAPEGIVQINETTTIHLQEEPVREMLDPSLRKEVRDLHNQVDRLYDSLAGGGSLSSLPSSTNAQAGREGIADGKRCGVCGETVPDRGAQYEHMRGHPIPDEARPPAICNHPPISLNVWWDGEVTLGDLPAGAYEKTYDTLPEEFRNVIEKEYRAGRNDIGWYFPKTRRDAYTLDVIYHMKWNLEFF